MDQFPVESHNPETPEKTDPLRAVLQRQYSHVQVRRLANLRFLHFKRRWRRYLLAISHGVFSYVIVGIILQEDNISNLLNNAPLRTIPGAFIVSPG